MAVTLQQKIQWLQDQIDAETFAAFKLQMTAMAQAGVTGVAPASKTPTDSDTRVTVYQAQLDTLKTQLPPAPAPGVPVVPQANPIIPSQTPGFIQTVGVALP